MDGRPRAGSAVERPAFWFSAAAVFLANVVLSAVERQWLVAALQLLTATWAVVAGVTAGSARPPRP